MGALLTASGLWRDAHCPANRALPRVYVQSDAAAAGTALHRYLERCAQVGAEKALAEVPEEYRARAADIDLDGLPLEPHYMQEAAFSFDGKDGRFLGCGLGRNYGEASLMAGTADVCHREGVIVFDYKFDGFDSTCPPVRENQQLLFLALACARSRNLDSALISIIHIRPDGTNWKEGADLDAFDLDAFAVELVRIAGAVAAARDAIARGLSPEVQQGPWCRFCAAMPACPSILETLRAAAAEPEQAMVLSPEGIALSAPDIAKALTPALASRAYARMRAVEQVLKLAKSALYLYASEHPIPLEGGYEYRARVTDKKEIDARVARVELAKLYGPEVAENACDFETSAAAIGRALKPVLSARKEEAKAKGEKRPTAKALEEEALAAIDKAGGIKRKTATRIDEYRAEDKG